MIEGFLLGGEKRYFPEKGEEKKYMDFSSRVPWILTGKGAKTYMIALTDEKGTVDKDGPALIWRAITDNTVSCVSYDDFIGEKSMESIVE